jgi:hypothetical protein
MLLFDERLLVGCAWGLVLVDALLLLRRDEFVVRRSWRGSIGLSFGAAGWRLSGREPWLPWSPSTEVYLGRWQVAEASRQPSLAPLPLPHVPKPLKALVWLQALWLAVGLPLGLALKGYALGAFVLGAYALALASVAIALPAAKRCGIDAAGRAKLAFESLVCLPLSINLVRKLTLRSRATWPLASVLAALPEAGRQQARRQLLARVQEQIDLEAEGSPRMGELQAAARALNAQAEA